MHRPVLILTFILCSFSIDLEGQSAVLLNEQDSIVLQVNQNSDPFYSHKIKAGETLYSLARFFRSNIKDILIINGLDQNSIIELGQEIIIPIDPDHLNKDKTLENSSGIGVYYSVKKKETLFRIAHVYFDQSVENLAARNQISSLALQPDQILKVGWWPIGSNITEQALQSPQDSDALVVKLDSIVQMIKLDTATYINSIDSSSLNPELDSLERIPVIEIQSKNGIAVWERSDENEETLLVLHRSASLGSAIKLQNPVTDNIVVAQVVGHIPDNVYTDDVDIVVSKAVAKKLGALDTRFMIIMTYYE